MRHLKDKKVLDRKRDARRALLRSLTVNLVLYGAITTTPAKARAVQRVIEPIISSGKKDGVRTQRYLQQILANRLAVQKVVGKIAPANKARAGGYTRITRKGVRAGDGASLAKLEFISYE